MKPVRPCAIFLFSLPILASCVTVKIDERTAFAPPKRDVAPATSVAELNTRYYEAKQKRGVEKGIWRIVPTGDGATQMLYEEKQRQEAGGRPLPLQWYVRHGFIGTGERRIAWTQFSDQNPTNPQRPLVVHCSGNAGDRYRSGTSYARDAFPWADVLVFDYPGYGDTPGPASAANFDASARSLVDHIVSVYGNRSLVFWGHSLGGFVCSHLASMVPETDGLILETTAPNAAAVARAWTPSYARLFVRTAVAPSLARYDVVNDGAQTKVPILVLGGGKDQVLPVTLARQVADGLKSRNADVTYIEFPEAGHLDVAWQTNYNDVLTAYFSKIESQP
jgi:pimeloyl-ACP methyl ester carboxylesterase